MVRGEVEELLALGQPPSSEEVIRSRLVSLVEKYEKLIGAIEKPVTDEEATVLVRLFGCDDFFGMGWTLPHLIETAPNWPIEGALKDVGNEWIAMLKDRAERWRAAGYPARSFYREAGLPDPRSTDDVMSDGGPEVGTTGS